MKEAVIMTIRHLSIFVCVYKERGITAAAKKLYLAQPAVSQVIKEMEKYYNEPLFDRISKRLYPTACGKKLYLYATKVLSAYSEMEKAMQREETHDIYIGTSITIGSHMISRYIKKIEDKYPNYKLHIQINSSDTIEKMLLNATLDFGLIEGQIHSNLIQTEKFADDKLVVICPPDHQILSTKNISLKTLLKYPLLLREPGSGTREIFDNVMRSNGLSYQPNWESVSTQAIVNGVSNGIGISVLPEKMVADDLTRKRIFTVSIKEKLFLREYYIITHKHKHLSNEALDLIKLIKQEELAK